MSKPTGRYVNPVEQKLASSHASRRVPPLWSNNTTFEELNTHNHSKSEGKGELSARSTSSSRTSSSVRSSNSRKSGRQSKNHLKKTNSESNNSRKVMMMPEVQSVPFKMEPRNTRSSPTPYHTPPFSATSRDELRKAAAVKIQRWFRRQKRVQQEKLLKMLMSKKTQLNHSILEDKTRLERIAQQRSQLEIERQKRKQDRAKDARQAAIAALQQKREEKRLLAEQVAAEEFATLETSGKVKAKSTIKLRAKKSKDRDIKVKTVQSEAGDPTVGVCDTQQQQEEAVTVNDIFQTNSTSRSSPLPTKPPSPLHNEGSRYYEIMEALKELETEPSPLNKQPYSVCFSELDGAVMTSQTDQPEAASKGKIKDILSYLDEVEASSSKPLYRPVPKTEGSGTPASATGGCEEDAMRLNMASATASDVAMTIQTLRMEVEDKDKTILMLQKALTQQRELTIYHAKEQEKEGHRRLEIQKDDYEAAIKRHLSFIDQLIDDKKALSEKCEKLVTQMKEMERKYTMNSKTMEERHSIELERQKDNLIQAEKSRRERWIQEQSKKIKEVTVRGLEPEIQRIIAKHKAELSKLKAVHEADLLQADERASRKFLQQTQELREQLQLEKESACAREREQARNQYEKAASQEEAAYQQQRRRLYAEIEEEKARVSSLGQQQRAEIDHRMKEMIESHSKAISECKSEYERILSEQERRHSTELRDLQERLKIEKEAWEENYMKKQETVLLAKERELRDRLRQERDKEIELVISRLEDETSTAKDEAEKAAENRIRRIKDKYEAELKEMEKSEKSTLDRYKTMKENVVTMESELVDVKALLKRKDNEINQISEVSAKLTKERDNVTEVVREEFAERLVTTEEENKKLKMEMSELKARHKVEMDELNRKMEKEMEQVHERVKQAIAKKEDALNVLRTEHEAGQKRADHLEMLLDRQRKELLKK